MNEVADLQKLYRRLSWMLLLVWALIAGGTLYASFWLQNRIVQEEIDHLGQHLSLSYKQDIAQTLQDYQVQASKMLEMPGVKEAMRRRDRSTLHGLTQALYAQWIAENPHVSVVQFHQPDNLTLLRLHNPSQYGDDARAWRPMIVQANQERHVLSGFEIGKNELAYRIVVPAFSGAEYLGLLEIGIGAGYFSQRLDQTFGIQTHTVYVRDAMKAWLALNKDEAYVTVSGYLAPREVPAHWLPALENPAAHVTLTNGWQQNLVFKHLQIQSHDRQPVGLFLIADERIDQQINNIRWFSLWTVVGSAALYVLVSWGFQFMLRRIEQRQAQLQRIQQIATETSAALASVVDQEGLDQVVHTCLQRLGELMQVDRSFVLLFSAAGTRIHNTHEWCALPAYSKKARIQDLPFDSRSWFRQEMLAGRNVHWPDFSHLPAEADVEKQEFQAQKIRSLLCLPASTQQEGVQGMVGFECYRHTCRWPDSHILVLRLVADSIGATLARLRAEQILKQSEETTRLLFEQSPDPVWIIENQRFVQCNESALHFLGYTDKAMLANRHVASLSPALQPDGEDSYQKAQRLFTRSPEQPQTRFEWLYCRADGSEFLAEVTLSHLEIAGNPILYCTWRDITESKQAAQLLQRLNEELETRITQRTAELKMALQEAERANLAKSEFLSRMSHELRTPLNAILGFAQILEYDDALSHDQQDTVQEISKAGRHLLDHVNEILDLSRIESGRIELHAEAVDVALSVHDCLQQVKPLAKQRNVSLTLHLSEELQVQADPMRLRQIVLNLLSNAIKYNRAEGEVHIHTMCMGQRVRIEVHDTGRGIAPEHLQRLFTPFERFEAAQDNIEGTGIGLALVKRLVEAMQGELGVLSTPGSGSVFWFELPTAP